MRREGRKRELENRDEESWGRKRSEVEGLKGKRGRRQRCDFFLAPNLTISDF